MAEDKMVGWYHQLNGHEFDQALGDGEGQGSLTCCSPWDCKELDTTEWLNYNNKVHLGYQENYYLCLISFVKYCNHPLDNKCLSQTKGKCYHAIFICILISNFVVPDNYKPCALFLHLQTLSLSCLWKFED